jgi:hypothetical protein
MNWNDISYLKRGNHRQRQAYTALHSLGCFDRLAEYTPVLVGTVPLSIDIFDSDLDILCFARDLPVFTERVRALFGGKTNFQLKTKPLHGVPSVIVRFEHAGFPIELISQAIPVEHQNGYRHLIIESRLLQIGGDEMAETIRQIKQTGLKTEPAFAQYLHLEGDPYQALLEMGALDDEALKEVIEQHV